MLNYVHKKCKYNFINKDILEIFKFLHLKNVHKRWIYISNSKPNLISTKHDIHVKNIENI